MQALCSVAADALDKPGAKRCTSSWPPEQDSMLVELIKLHGVGGWKMIAKKLENKTPKQCRDRWYYKLNPVVKKGNWTKEEV
jgi:hypothetical protein